MTPQPTDTNPGRLHRPAVSTAIAGVTVAILLAIAPAVSAYAHGDDEPTTALALVRQAIALIVNTPDDTEMIADKVNDAAESENSTGVQTDLVEQAKDALAAGDLHKTRALLEQSIGARVHTGDADPVVIGQVPPPAAGADTGTLAAVDALPGRGGLRGGEWALLFGCLLVVAGGLVLSFRLRPHRVHIVRPEVDHDEHT